MQLSSHVQDYWPSLAWVARCRGTDIEVFSGPRVEVSGSAVCEAVWPGEYVGGDFDRSPVVAGTGVRVRDGHVCFVSSASTVDRLHSIGTGDGVFVSNSLPALLTATSARLHPRYQDYGKVLGSIVNGLNFYRPHLQSSVGRIRQTFFNNLVWTGEQLEVRAKPGAGIDLRDFEDYREYLKRTLEAITGNMASAERRFAYSLLGTLSSGYDANAVTAIGVACGCDQAVCFDVSRTGEPDSGESVAEALGIRALPISRATWRAEAARYMSLPEVPFLAAMPDAGLAPFGAAMPELRGRVLLTGFYGDSIWDLHAKKLAPDIARKDPSGLSLTEFRLHAGFIHCAPTFWTAREIKDIAAISTSMEMRQWVTGEEYQRPIPRRILEDAGVPREAFGTTKQPGIGGSRFVEREFLAPRSMSDYLDWLRRHRQDLAIRPLPLSPAIDRLRWDLATLIRGLASRVERLQTFGRPRWLRRLRRWAKREQSRRRYIRRWAFFWAMERAQESYSTSDPCATTQPSGSE